MSDGSIKSHTTSNNSLAPSLNYIYNKIRVKLDGSCLKQEKVTFTHKQVVNIYTAYEINLWSFIADQDFTLENSLFSVAKLTTNADSDKYKYCGYVIRFDGSGNFSLSDGRGFGKNIIMFGADIGSSVNIHNKKKNILNLAKGPKQGLDNIALSAEKQYSINFHEQQRKVCLCMIIIICLLMVLKSINSKQKIMKLMQLHYVWVMFHKFFS